MRLHASLCLCLSGRWGDKAIFSNFADSIFVLSHLFLPSFFFVPSPRIRTGEFRSLTTGKRSLSPVSGGEGKQSQLAPRDKSNGGWEKSEAISVAVLMRQRAFPVTRCRRQMWLHFPQALPLFFFYLLWAVGRTSRCLFAPPSVRGVLVTVLRGFCKVKGCCFCLLACLFFWW